MSAHNPTNRGIHNHHKQRMNVNTFFMTDTTGVFNKWCNKYQSR